MKDSKEEVETAVNGFLDKIEKTREEMEELSHVLHEMQIRFVFKHDVTYEQANEWWNRELVPKKEDLIDCKRRLQNGANWLADRGMSRKRWESIKPQFAEWRRAWDSFVVAQKDFRRPLDAEFHRRRGLAEGWEEGRKEGVKESAETVMRSSNALTRTLKEKESLEKKLTAAKQKSEEAQRKSKKAKMKVKALEKELKEKNAVISKIRSASEFYAKCRDFARDYCKNTKDNVSEAVRKLIEEDWFSKGIAFHDIKWFPKKSSGSAAGHTNEAMIGNIVRDIKRWKAAKTPSGKPKTPWKLPWEN